MARHDDPVWEAVRGEITRRAVVLRERPYAELSNLPDYQTDETDILGEAITYTTYRIAGPPRPLQIVVQGYRKGYDFKILRTGQMYAEGFRISSAGVVDIMREDELYDYM